MMAYHQRVNQFKSRIDFDDPTTTKPPSLAKSAVLQALEEEERQQQSRGKGGGGGFLLQQSRPSRSRQREPVATAAAERARTPCINRDTVLRINRRPVRHRSCDSFWPPAKTSARSPSPRGQLGGAEGGSFAYDVGAYGGHYGSHESVYFDERVRRQHKIDPLRTMFDKANVVLEDWGGRGKTKESPSQRLSDNGVYDGRRQEKVVGDDDAGNNSVKQGEMIESEKNLPELEPPPRPPYPPPRRYFLPMDQLQSGVGIEILLRCYGAAINQSESQEISPFKIDDGSDSRQQAKQQQALPPLPPPPGFSPYPEDRALHQDGILSKPPLKSRATPTRRAPSKPPTPTIGHVSLSDDPASTSANRDEFNINSNTILNLNIDNTSPSTAVPQITMTDCPQQQQPRGATSKTNDQLWHEIIDENHNYDEKLITTSSGQAGVAEFGIDDPQLHYHPLSELPNEQHSKLNVSNQANRNWINLNSNEIYPHSSSDAASDWDDAAAARVTKTRVRQGPDAPDANDAPTLTVIRNDIQRQAADNYDNKSIKSNYWTDDDNTSNNNSNANPNSSRQLRRSESRDSSRSWRVDEVLEFPPPPPYLCDCDDAGSSGRCSVEEGRRAQSHVVVAPCPGGGDNPTISQSCRRDSTADVCPSFGDRWDDNRAGATTTATAAATDDYFKTNLTDDKFLIENVNTACNLRRSQSKHRQLYYSSDSDHRQRPDQASSTLHKSIDEFLAHEREDGHQMSFTDGEYIFGPYDDRSEEFQHFNLWSSEFRELRRNCRHQQRTHEAVGSDSSSGTNTLVPPQQADGSSCSCSVISSSDTLRGDSKTPEWRQHQPAPSKQVENFDDAMPGNVPAGNVPPPAATSYQHRWVRFENGNICPPPTTTSAPLTRVPTPYPSPTGSPSSAKDELDHDEIFDRFAEQLKPGHSTDESAAAMVENVPLIDAVLDDLLTFSRNLGRDHDDDDDDDDDEGRAAAKIVEINDDNLINLLADDDNADAGVGRGRTQANEDSCKAGPEKDSADGLEKSLPSKPWTPLGSCSANSADVDGEKCDQNTNEARKRDVSEDNYLNREDVFTNVAIFSWNPLDVYQQHGLFMIDPRFALADLHATTEGCNRSTVDAHPSVRGRRPEDDTDAATTSSSIGMLALTDGADPSSDADVNSFATQRGDVLLLESHKIPNDASPTVDHFYDSAHVEYPVRSGLSLSLSSATAKECHQSPPSPSSSPQPLVESDYDNDLAKCNPQDAEDQQEGLKRVAWPPSAESGDEYEQVQQQQPQPQQHQQQQQQQYYQQPQAQHQPAPTYQQYQQPAHQQQQPRERIIPIQRTTSHISPQRTPKSPLGGGHQQPRYPQQKQPASSSTVAFSGGRAVLPQQQQQQQYYQPAPRPVSAPHHLQVQLQQQNRYSSPSTASLGSPRSPQIVGGGHSPRGWSHVQSPVPVYRPAPQHQQQQQQQYVPPPFQSVASNPTAYQRQASGGYGPRKPDQQQQQQSPASPQLPQYQPQPTQAFQPLVSQQQQQFYQPEQQQQLHQHQQPEAVPFFTTLRSEPPMSQEPAPVYQAQPVAAIYQGGSNMRGDQKWPPEEVKKQSELENEERRRLAQEPAFRPRKVAKDYSNFFAKNALNQTYPGYRAPPGTQHHS